MALNDGDLVLFDYTLRVDGKVWETSLAADAEAEKVQLGKGVLFTLGLGQVVPGVEEEVRMHGEEALQKGDSVALRTFTVPPEKAFGLRSRENVHTVPLKPGMKLEPGMQVEMGGKQGTIVRVGGGRVVIDTHHALAGKTLDYAYRLRGIYTTPQEKVGALLRHMLGEDCAHAWEDDLSTLRVEVPGPVAVSQRWATGRHMVVRNLRLAAMNPRQRVVFVEPFDPPPLIPPKVQESPQPEKPAEAA